MTSIYVLQVQTPDQYKAELQYPQNGHHVFYRLSGTTRAKTADPLHQNCSPSDVVHLLLLADVDLEISVALVDADNLILTDLVA